MIFKGFKHSNDIKKLPKKAGICAVCVNVGMMI